MAKRVRFVQTTKPAKVPEATITAPEAARVIPPEEGSPDEDLGWNPQTNSPKYYRRGYCLVDEYASPAAAIAAYPAGGEFVFRGDAPYVVPIAGLQFPLNANIYAKGDRGALFEAPGGATGDAVIKLWPWSGSTRIEGVEIDCKAHATMTRGLVSEGNETQRRDLRTANLVVRNALGAGIYTWQTNNVVHDHPQVHDCGFGIYADDVVGTLRILYPEIINTVSGRMQFGIRVRRWEALDEADAEIIAPYVDGADYATATGAEAHGISISGVPHWKVIGGKATRCGNPANKLGGGFVAAHAHAGSISDFTSMDNHATGYWFELEPGGDTTLGTAGQVRGVQGANLSAIGNGAAGISGSYGAGLSISGLIAAMNGVEGFVTDADGVILTNFRVLNNWQDSGAPAPVQNGGAKAGIRSYTGVRNIFANGHCYDNQAVKTQAYGIAVEERGHVLTSIVSLTADHITGGLVETAAGAANTKTAVVT